MEVSGDRRELSQAAWACKAKLKDGAGALEVDVIPFYFPMQTCTHALGEVLPAENQSKTKQQQSQQHCPSKNLNKVKRVVFLRELYSPQCGNEAGKLRLHMKPVS